MRIFAVFSILLLSYYVKADNKILQNKQSAKDSIKAIVDTSKAKEVETRSFLFGIDYATDNTYKGLKQDTKVGTFSPSIMYQSITGFYCIATGYYVKTDKIPWNEFDADLGYDFKLYKNVSNDISYTRSFFSKTTSMLKSSSANDLEYFLKFKPSWIKTKLIFDYNFGKINDYSTTFQISHSFKIDSIFSKKDEFAFMPKISIIAGTQNFYVAYYKAYFINNKAKIDAYNQKVSDYNNVNSNVKKKKKQAQPIVYNPPSENKFSMLSYEFVIPLSYDIGQFSLMPSFHYLISVNQPTEGKIKGLTQVGKSNLNSSTYFEISLTYNLETR